MTNQKVEGWYGVIKALKENVEVIDAKIRCIDALCQIDSLSHPMLGCRLSDDMNDALQHSKTKIIIGEYPCKGSELIAKKYGKEYRARQEAVHGYIPHNLEAECSYLGSFHSGISLKLNKPEVK